MKVRDLKRIVNLLESFEMDDYEIHTLYDYEFDTVALFDTKDEREVFEYDIVGRDINKILDALQKALAKEKIFH